MTRELRPYAAYIAMASGATAAAGLLRVGGFAGFERFLGPLPPVLTVAGAGVVGLESLRFLRHRGFWRTASRSRTVRGLALATVATVPFAAAAIAVDVAVGFERDMNVTWPGSLLFYPVITLVAETVFHLLPLASLVWATRWRFSQRTLDERTWAVILAAALVEPIAQVALGSSLPVFVMPHVYLIGVVQLVLLRRYGYLPMIWFRVCYYLLWHVLWGAARLELLF